MRMFAFLAVAFLAGCASKPLPPDWQGDAKGLLDASVDDYLKGNTAAARSEFRDARRATTSTGRPDYVAQVELVRCAAQVASLDFDDCPGYLALALEATPAQRAYADYLYGRWQGLDAALLPEQHRPVLATGQVANLADPLARLVAAGASFKAGRMTPEGIALVIDTASNQGWRRPLLAWLGVQVQRAEAAGNTPEVLRIRRRIALVSGED
ncbi:hypothetical protein [Telluria aromaticivorans]|uniref:Uncharacterized protein n=1 Tax=Telluria aromaticivorans TaxID=2725995 RepID=A0A7Y2NYT2_9BURK|nr:hypothetical protein [Telluria aromaticivorans]NNG21821.1 hypothetical protein [Telluria aromaticivorans]